MSGSGREESGGTARDASGIRTYADLTEADASDLGGQIARQRRRVAVRLAPVDRVLAVASGKGGVGKSFVAAGLAVAAAEEGARTALLDADFAGPTAARLMGARSASLRLDGGGVHPAASPAGVPFVSADLLLEEDRPLRWREPDRGEGFVWRGAQEQGMLREFLADVVWGERDWLVVDLPPGAERLEQVAGLAADRLAVVAVTLPSGASRSSVVRSLHVAREHEVPVLGIVENMSGYACPGCGERSALFPGDAGREVAGEAGVPFLGAVPFDPEASALADRGDVPRLLATTAAGRVLRDVARRLLEAP